MGEFLLESLGRYIGQTVTIFTTSGGLSGNGFTGVLAGICGCTIKLITDIGAPPACPIGSACCGGYFDGGFEEEVDGFAGGWCGMFGRCRERGRRRGCRGRYNWLGSVSCQINQFSNKEIKLCRPSKNLVITGLCGYILVQVLFFQALLKVF